MINLIKKNFLSSSKILNLQTYFKKQHKFNKFGTYNSKKNFFNYIPFKVIKSLKLGNKISKNLIRLILKDLRNN
uniref:Uncharacterized protein n=1 Tax=Nephromyces sp. ex Molgula occidentalis TaxID=2544991 RepID=A0A5C1HAI1_9APIC|nr:hypothetical protein [Nephromyces sp. ex Molgula occidentalis]